MIFFCSPLLLIRDENLPPLKEIIHSLLNDLEIPIKVVENVTQDTYKQLGLPPVHFNVAYIIITIKYLNKFEA